MTNTFEVKVKTLDGRTREFRVPEEATVAQFKELIEVEMDIEVERQRLLYQGRVLQDDLLLSSYDVAGNVMHLVTRMPPQARSTGEVTVNQEENSDINRDQIRNILSDVLSNIGDLNHPMGVSVNNEGNRMDITVNIPTQNRLSLSRLRQNYVYRLLHQARNVINHMEDPSITVPRSDRERLRQPDPYDIGPNEERLTEVTSHPLPISNLADMIGVARSLWTSAEPHLVTWESVLRREISTDTNPRTESEMQGIHDSTSRYIHLFSHILHILSDYLVEFQHTNIDTRIPAANVNVSSANDVATSVSLDDSNVPLTGAFGESGLAHSDNNVSTDIPAEIGDRSRYLYVFSEMPAQLVQVRLDVDNIRDMRSSTTAQTTTSVPQSQTNVQPSIESTQQNEAQINSTINEPATSTETNDSRARSRRRVMTNDNTVDNLFRSTLQDTLMGSNTRPQMTSGTSHAIHTTPQFMENVDPYVRCQSRHFQHPSNLRSGAVISTFSGIRTSRPRTHANEFTPISTANTITVPMTNVRTTSTDLYPMRMLFSGLMSSILSAPRGTSVTQPEATPSGALEQPRILQTFTHGGVSNMNAPLSQVFPDMFNAQQLDPDNLITNEIMQLVINRLTLTDLLAIIRGQYSPINQLRLPLQEVLCKHQQEVGSRETLIDHVVSDLEFFNRSYISVFERLRSGSPVENLSDEARNSFNVRLDIIQTLNNLNRYHFQSMIDMIMRSPTNQGFGHLLMNSLTTHHEESLALIDIICNNNDELRRYLIKSFLNSLVSSINSSTDQGLSTASVNQNILGHELFGDINSGWFGRPEQLAELKQHTLMNFVVYLPENNDSDQSIGNIESIEDMVTNLSDNITYDRTTVSDNDRVLPEYTSSVVSEFIREYQQGGESIMNGVSSWQNILPQEWLQIMSHDSNVPIENDLPYSDAYVSGLPPKRRKVIIGQRQRSIQPSSTLMMQDCLNQAISSVGFENVIPLAQLRSLPVSLNDCFQDMVTERVNKRLTEEAFNFPSQRFPSTDRYFNRKNRNDDDKKMT